MTSFRGSNVRPQKASALYLSPAFPKKQHRGQDRIMR